MGGATDQIATLAGALRDQGALKLWSVIVTIMGDQAPAEGDEIPGRILSIVIGRIGLQPNAMRVALHRLMRDGWIEARKVSRSSYYRLSDYGRGQSDAARGLIYGTASLAPAPVGLCVSQGGGKSALTNKQIPTLRLTKTAHLMLRSDFDAISDHICAPLEQPMPGWAAERARTQACVEDFENLLALLSGVSDAAGGTPLDRAALRVLVIHGWRRLILKAHPVALALDGDAARACGTRVHALLKDLPSNVIGPLAV